MKSKIDLKYVQLLNKTFEKYKKIDVVFNSHSVKVVKIHEECAQNTKHQIVPNILRKRFETSESSSRAQAREYRKRKTSSHKPFLAAEDEVLLEILNKTPPGEKVRYSVVCELVKKLGRNDHSIVGRMRKLRKGNPNREKKPFLVHEDFMIIDEAFKNLLDCKSLQNTVLPNSKELAVTLNRNAWSIEQRWINQIKIWLLQYFKKTLNLEVRPMLANLLVNHFKSYEDIDWKFVMTFPEFSGHTEGSLRMLFYSKMINYTMRHLKLKRSEITLENIAEDAKINYANTSAVTKPVEKRQKELIEYFEKLVDKHKISNFVD